MEHAPELRIIGAGAVEQLLVLVILDFELTPLVDQKRGAATDGDDCGHISV